MTLLIIFSLLFGKADIDEGDRAKVLIHKNEVLSKLNESISEEFKSVISAASPAVQNYIKEFHGDKEKQLEQCMKEPNKGESKEDCLKKRLKWQLDNLLEIKHWLLSPKNGHKKPKFRQASNNKNVLFFNQDYLSLYENPDRELNRVRSVAGNNGDPYNLGFNSCDGFFKARTKGLLPTNDPDNWIAMYFLKCDAIAILKKAKKSNAKHIDESMMIAELQKAFKVKFSPPQGGDSIYLESPFWEVDSFHMRTPVRSEMVRVLAVADFTGSGNEEFLVSHVSGNFKKKWTYSGLFRILTKKPDGLLEFVGDGCGLRTVCR